MDVIESLQKVLDKIIKRLYPNISYIDVSVSGYYRWTGGWSESVSYEVTYHLNDKMDESDARKIVDETYSLFTILNPEKDSVLSVTFEKDEE